MPIPPLQPRLEAAYRAAVYRIALQRKLIEVQIGARSEPMRQRHSRTKVTYGCIVTAVDPFSDARSAREKRAANERLRQDILAFGLTPLPASIEATAQKGERADGWYVADVTMRQVDRCLQAFSQHAAVMIDAKGYATLRFHPSHGRSGYVYVVALAPAVQQHAGFAARNRRYTGKRRCVYVGSTGHSPEERFAQHKAGIKAGKKIVMRFGTRLMPGLYATLNPVPNAEREKRERLLATELRQRGYGVWQA